jgi:hypothetical protein
MKSQGLFMMGNCFVKVSLVPLPLNLDVYQTSEIVQNAATIGMTWCMKTQQLSVQFKYLLMSSEFPDC